MLRFKTQTSTKEVMVGQLVYRARVSICPDTSAVYSIYAGIQIIL